MSNYNMKALVLPVITLGTALAWNVCADPPAPSIKPPVLCLTNSPVTSTNSLLCDNLQPGVYETRPFTCIVVVPGNHLDDKMIIGGKGNQPSMPIKTPGLEFIPHGKGK